MFPLLSDVAGGIWALCKRQSVVLWSVSVTYLVIVATHCLLVIGVE